MIFFMKVVSLFICLIFLQSLLLPVFAQEKSSVKFGKISAEDFKTKIYSIDSNAAAVVIADIGSADILAERNWFQVIYKRFRRVHILKKSGYDAATFVFPVFVSPGGDEGLDNLKAVTYNYENGQVLESKLDMKTSVFTEKLTKNIHLKKLTLPNVKEGSIIEIEFKMISSSVSSMPSWEFQGEYPVLWSEYNAAIPEFFYYLFLPQGLQNYYIKEKKETSRGYILDLTAIYLTPTKVAFSAAVNEHRWVHKNVPGLKREPFTASLSNHISKIEFVLSAFRYPLQDRNLMLEWKEVTNTLLKDEYFGLQYTKDNTWLNDEINNNVKGLSGDMNKARSIFNYLRDNLRCVNYNQIFPASTLKDILKDKRGGVASINLLLIAMLRKAGIKADPVMLSTKSHGYPPVLYPDISKFNYLICLATIEGKKYYLDASRPQLGFGWLEAECYNGHAKIINETATGIDLLSDSLVERKITSINISNDEQGNLTGYAQQSPGYYESYKIRKIINEKGKEEFLKELQSEAGSTINISNLVKDSLKLYDDPVRLTFDIKMYNEKTETIYINPMLGEEYKENPFKSANRLYPVEMPYTVDEAYILKMEVPKGYQLEELPKPARLNYDEDGKSFFEYLISEKNGTIMLRSRVKIARTFFTPDEYEVLREFFAQIVNKHNEQIVFKKKK
jgi:hypothetical protein